jgi:hypothetical protein
LPWWQGPEGGDAGCEKNIEEMNYELAEQLKDAGFPQSGDGRRIGAPTAFLWRARDLVYVPTLEELIAACGDQFGEMVRLPDGSFVAVAHKGTPRQRDKSPAEAVARLWLVLNRAH